MIKLFKRLFNRNYNYIIKRLELLKEINIKTDFKVTRYKGEIVLITFNSGGKSYKLDLNKHKGFVASYSNYYLTGYNKCKVRKVLLELESKIDYYFKWYINYTTFLIPKIGCVKQARDTSICSHPAYVYIYILSDFKWIYDI